MNSSAPVTRNLVRWLLATEAAAHASPVNGYEVLAVCEKLRNPLCVLAGLAGFKSLLSRALTLARAEDPSLNGVRVSEEGFLDGLDKADRQLGPPGAVQGEFLIACLIDLLITFIGQSLVLQIVRDVWPDAPFESPELETKP